MWHNVWAVIRREYLQRVRSKWFIMVTLLAPIIMIAMIVIPTFMATRSDRSDRDLLIVDGSGGEVDSSCVYLAGPDADALTGADIFVDGGVLAS